MNDNYYTQKFEKYLEENWTPTDTPDLYAYGGTIDDVCHIDDILMNWHEEENPDR
jgi:hypothetical protein